MSAQLKELKKKRNKLESSEHETSFEHYRHCTLKGCKCNNRSVFSHMRIGKIVPYTKITDEEWIREKKIWLKKEASIKKRMNQAK